ncbi:MAG TPA: hypothetical protein VH092_07320 [Urbifossiella sp.]|jgi:hypothetical protein|nr:hypothetical protein [Urbifossiella sp.]
MPEIVLTEEQTRQVPGPGAPKTIVVKDATGRVVGQLETPPSPEWIAEMKRRIAAPGPRYSSASVMAMLDALQAERDRIGPFSVEYARAFVEQLERDDPDRYGPTVTR